MDKLEQAAADYAENGFAIIRDVVPQDLMAEVRQHVDWLLARYPELRPEHLHHPLIRNDAFWVRMIMDPHLLDVVEPLLGPDLACFTAHYICKPAHDGQAVLWHQDGAYWKLEPMKALSVWLAVDPSTTANGCLRMVPKTHQVPLYRITQRNDVPNLLFSASDQRIVDELVEQHGVVDIELQPGDVSVHHPNVLHWSEANTSGQRRCGLDIGYIPTSTRISSDGVYLNPVLVRGAPVPGVNVYRPIPEYQEGETIPFAGREEWSELARRSNQANAAVIEVTDDRSPTEAAQHMVSRLREGSTAR